MTGSERTNISASMSGAPSLVNSLNSYSSSTKLNGSQANVKSPIPEPSFVDNFLEKAKFYTSLCLGTSAILSVFAFLFLIPFVVDPAISTIVADYDQRPVTCMVVDHKFSTGMRNCTWSSCREGCTTAAIRCHKLLVNYTKVPWEEWLKNPPDLEKFEWDVSDTRLLINSEGCGYPPHVNCTEFAKKFGYSHVGEPFPCYYSRAYPEMVITRLISFEDNLKHLILSLIIPNIVFAISIGVLSYWYCPCCDKACRKSTRVYTEKYPNKEDPISAWNFSNDDYLHQPNGRVVDQRRISPSELHQQYQQQQQRQQPISFQSNRWQLARAAQYQIDERLRAHDCFNKKLLCRSDDEDDDLDY